MNFYANNASDVIAIRDLLIYCLHYNHILGLVGAKKNKEPDVLYRLIRLSGSLSNFVEKISVIWQQCSQGTWPP